MNLLRCTHVSQDHGVVPITSMPLTRPWVMLCEACKRDPPDRDNHLGEDQGCFLADHSRESDTVYDAHLKHFEYDVGRTCARSVRNGRR